MDSIDPQITVAARQIAWIHLLPPGANAMVIALACCGLPENPMRGGIRPGAGTVVLPRIGAALRLAHRRGMIEEAQRG